MKDLEVQMIRVENVLVIKLVYIAPDLVNKLSEEDEDKYFMLKSLNGTITTNGTRLDVGSKDGMVTSYRYDSVESAKEAGEAFRQLITNFNERNKPEIKKLDVEEIM
jgi:glycerol-3-phosphate responsive antiterminator